MLQLLLLPETRRMKLSQIGESNICHLLIINCNI
jgi:hypothetical protein